MQQMKVWPDFERGDTLGARYVTVNAMLLRLARELDIDLWTLDALFWHLSQRNNGPLIMADPPAEVAVQEQQPQPVTRPGIHFGMERHLHDFLFDHWNQTPLGTDWSIHSEPGEPDAGYEYICAVGRIDILARHRRENQWLVIELKRNATSDYAVGQALRYMGWVTHHLADPGAVVRGLIIAGSGDQQLQYAVHAVPNLDFMTYEVEFRLNAAPALAGRANE